MSWRFCLGWAGISIAVEVERLVDSVVALAGASALTSLVVDVMAAVRRLICAPTWAVAAVLSRRFEDGERGARVASRKKLVSMCEGGMGRNERTDGAGVNLYGGV